MLLVLFVVNASAQPEPCDVKNPQMTPTCIEACIICNIDGFTGRHESAVRGTLPANFCTHIVHNAQWIAFQAASTSLKIKLTVGNCVTGDGLEMGIYKSIDCQSFKLISNCEGEVRGGQSAIFTMTEPLVIGQYYYLAMDGNNGDNCNWTFEVLEGSTAVDPLTVTAPIQGVDRTCPDIDQVFTTEPETGAVLFDWTLNGQPVGDPTLPSITLNFPQEGLYNLCVTARNACDEATTTCKEIQVGIPTPDTLPILLCTDDCFAIGDTLFCEDGIHTYSFPGENGCDSVVIVNISRVRPAVKDLTLTICEGDTVFLGNTPYYQAGYYQQMLQSSAMCDSLINLDLEVIRCNIQVEYSVVDVSCFGDRDGEIRFELTNGNAPFTYIWQHLREGLTGEGSISALNTEEIISGLPRGTVAIKIMDAQGNHQVLLIDIETPDPLLLFPAFSDHDGSMLSCYGGSDGVISVTIAGGASPYQYLWDTGEESPTATNLAAGNCALTVTDAQGCQLTESFEVTSPPPLEATLSTSDASCDGYNTGSIIVHNVEGGTGPYLFSLNGSEFASKSRFDSLAAGIYALIIRDDQGCSTQTESEIRAPIIPELTGLTNYEVHLGDEVQLEIQSSTSDLSMIRWEGVDELSCNSCLEPVVKPLQSGAYRIWVSSADLCRDSLSLYIQVIKNRNVFAPNVFSPNSDSNNDFFTLFGNKELDYFNLSIYNRWGDKLFGKNNLVIGNEQDGWDGTRAGLPVEAGVYVWVAELHFIDGETEIRKGDVSVVK
ncbi:MAG: gliding motility-associated C-terminal domain-containing protein [Saprospiraceae bacterium]|nr:gliding motility-associated C-terminal domain-containing protein [Saprospiraceae bacterium]MCB9320071.1 gliding motility-associated C-terminal domain-containing protein [Lewinellaceae bacterium]